MGSHERIKDAQLVKLHPQVVLGHAKEARQVIAGEGNPRETQGEDHVHRQGHI